VQLTGNVGGRNYDGIGGLTGIGFGMEIAAGKPKLISAILNTLGIVYFVQLFQHQFYLLICLKGRYIRI
jgi:hypothetical protein